MRELLCCALVGLACGTGALAQPAVRGGPGAGMATRSVSAYLGLERELAQSLQARDRQAVRQFIGDAFEVRSPDAQEATSAEDWLNEQVRHAPSRAIVRDLAVREFNDIATVSFLMDATRVINGKPVPSTVYMVDVWQQSTHKLLVRYVSTPRQAIPAPSRPTGRE